jgi:hypothetical protein
MLLAGATQDGKLHWDLGQTVSWEEDDNLVIGFSCSKDSAPDRVDRDTALRLEQNCIDWLIKDRSRWTIDLDKMRRWATNVTDFHWATGVVQVIPKIQSFGESSGHYLTFHLTEQYMKDARPRRIFLSHKGADKALVKEFHITLKLLGFDPWLDEDALAAGANLERALQQGMKESCAAVFFITKSYRDAGYLAAEIDYAIKEKRQKGDRFSIVTLLLDQGAAVPELLTTYVYRQPVGNLEALREIIRALPIQLPPPEWK